jgi:hypothetical protein
MEELRKENEILKKYKMKKPENDLWKLIQEFPDKPWYWGYISCNECITWEIIRDNPDKPWDWWGISRNPNITWEIIQSNPKCNWDWFDICKNKSITWEIIRDNPDKRWDWEHISANTFNYKKRMKDWKDWKDYNARLIQHQAKHWLYSAPNGPMYKKMVRDLQEDGFLLK